MSSEPRASAARVLVQVVVARRSLAEALPAGLQAVAGAQQRALVQELSYGTLRWYYRLDAMLGRLLARPLKQRDADIRCLLLAGLYQLDQLSIPPHAAVHETVQAARALNKHWAKGLVNAVLRSYLRQCGELEQVIAADETAKYAHPAWLIGRFGADWPEDRDALLAANNARPPFSLRINGQRLTREEYLGILAEQSIEAAPLANTSHGVVLERPLPVEDVPGFSQGIVSVQDGAAQLAAGLLQLAPGQRVLDACAAPGGKTAHILETEPELAALTALDIDARRLERVRDNLSRLGLQAELLQGDAGEPDSWWNAINYDRILLDVPCSATGVIRRHPDIKLLRKHDDIAVLARRQTKLLDAMWPLLAPGGMLLYCTCSVLLAENSGQLERFFGVQADAEELPIKASWGRACRFGRQVLTGEDDMDGFYFACLRKLA
jgi:16S rRNA (cytosine967-C5)-methyltransferase